MVEVAVLLRNIGLWVLRGNTTLPLALGYSFSGSTSLQPEFYLSHTRGLCRTLNCRNVIYFFKRSIKIIGFTFEHKCENKYCIERMFFLIVYWKRWSFNPLVWIANNFRKSIMYGSCCTWIFPKMETYSDTYLNIVLFDRGLIRFLCLLKVNRGSNLFVFLWSELFHLVLRSFMNFDTKTNIISFWKCDLGE